MDDKDFIESIKKATVKELLVIILLSPSYLTDSYYFDFGQALRARAKKLGVLSG